MGMKDNMLACESRFLKANKPGMNIFQLADDVKGDCNENLFDMRETSN